MDGRLLVFGIMMGACAISVIQSAIYNSRDHVKKGKGLLRDDAKIVGFDVKIVGSKNTKKYRTTVSFDDGFMFITHRTERKMGFGTYQISLSPEMKREILEDAATEHKTAVFAQDNLR